MKSNFGRQTLAAAIAMACAAATQALPLSDFNEESPDQVTLRIGGSSAHNEGLQTLMTLTETGAGGSPFCAPDTLDVWMSADKNDRLFFCTGAAGSGAAGKKLAIFKRSSGGSGTGVATVVRDKADTNGLKDIAGGSVSSKFIDIAALRAAEPAGVAQVSSNSKFSNFTLHTAAGALTLAAADSSDVGISDVEPTSFRNKLQTPITDAELNSLTVRGISSVIFGVPVPKHLYQRLQALEFKATSVCHPSNAAYRSSVTVPSTGASVANGNSEACMPSLTKQQLAGLYSGVIDSWTSIKSSTKPDVDVTNVVAGSLTPMTDPKVYIERRSPTSGTQTGFEIYFLGAGCATGAPAMLTNAAAPAVVTEHPASSAVITKLAERNDAKLGAIGVLTTEAKATAADGWRFIKVDGAAPSLINVVKGSYDLFFESTLQYLDTAVVNARSGTTLAALQDRVGGVEKKAVADAIATFISKPAVVASLDSSFQQLWGVGGLVGNAIDNLSALPTTPFTFVAPTSSATNTTSNVLVRPIATSSRISETTGQPNACLVPQPVGPTMAFPKR